MEPLTHRSHRVLGIGLALGPAEVAAHGQLFGTVSEQPNEGLDGEADAQVVGDHVARKRHVEVAAHEDPLARDRPEVFELGELHG